MCSSKGQTDGSWSHGKRHDCRRNRSTRMKRIAGPVLIFASYLGLVGGASALNRHSLFAEYADAAIVAVHFAVLALLSFYLIRDRRRGPGSCPLFLHHRVRRWMTDVDNPSK